MEKVVSNDVLSSAVSDVSNHWVLDSKASFHMTSNGDHLSSLVDRERSAILMGNDAFVEPWEKAQYRLGQLTELYAL